MAVAKQFGLKAVGQSSWGPTVFGVSQDPDQAHSIAQRISAQFAAMGGQATLRLKDGQPLVTDNGQHILDVRGLHITDPLAFESQVNQWPGVVTVGVFAFQKATVCLMGTASGVKTMNY